MPSTIPKPAKILSVPPTSSNTQASQPASLATIIQAFKALGIATGIVTASAGVAVLGFRYWTGIHTVSPPHILICATLRHYRLIYL